MTKVQLGNIFPTKNPKVIEETEGSYLSRKWHHSNMCLCNECDWELRSSFSHFSKSENESFFHRQLVDFCRAHNIFLLGFPPHTSHKLQLLDDLPLQIKDVAGIFGKAYLKMAIIRTATKGFMVTGVEPFNSIFDDEDFEPSRTTDILVQDSQPKDFPAVIPDPSRDTSACLISGIHSDDPDLPAPCPSLPFSLSHSECSGWDKTKVKHHLWECDFRI
ncbi:hypothetical protein J437_LFUL018500 [Ladona fulva]|uniref:Uncharacterized protein n=1 Tax=Ladona fulva TaxID=123851 RepID=A0A8K0KP82_LADFU|nr:hypothetical protein J437_LFUL018500 [Ladona fulva]